MTSIFFSCDYISHPLEYDYYTLQTSRRSSVPQIALNHVKYIAHKNIIPYKGKPLIWGGMG